MKKGIYSEWSNEKLLKSRNLLKGAFIGLGIVFLVAIFILCYLFFYEGFKNKSLATFIPVFTLPLTFLPVLSILSQLDKEIKSRKLE